MNLPDREPPSLCSFVVDAITTAQKLIAACGGKEAEKHVTGNVTT
jgi:hypothetical protein